MKLLKFHVLGAALMALTVGTAQAEPKNGFGLSGGLASHNLSGTKTSPPAGPRSYSSSGLSLGIDYQIAMTPELSLNPFLMTSGESTSGDLAPGVSAGHGILGLQLRYWADDMFFGGHIGSYGESLTNPSTGITTSGNGGGFGLVMGWENPQGGMFVTGQLDRANINYLDANFKLKAFRMSVGYRWK